MGLSREASLQDVVDRIVKRVRDSEYAKKMVERVTRFFHTHNPSDDLTRDEVRELYRGEDYGDEFDVGKRRELDVGWTNHAEYRSELRDVDPSKVNEAVRDFADAHQGPGGHRKVTLMKPGMGKAVVDLDMSRDPEQADVITVMAAEGKTAARTKYKSVEPTMPGSKNHYKVTYHDGQEKWVDARPGAGQPSRREQRLLKHKMNSPAVKRSIERLDKALGKYEKDEGPKPLQDAVVKNEVGLDKELARTINRRFVKDKKKEEGDGIGEKTKDGLQVVRDQVNRHRRDSSERVGRIVERVAGWDEP